MRGVRWASSSDRHILSLAINVECLKQVTSLRKCTPCSLFFLWGLLFCLQSLFVIAITMNIEAPDAKWIGQTLSKRPRQWQRELCHQIKGMRILKTRTTVANVSYFHLELNSGVTFLA